MVIFGKLFGGKSNTAITKDTKLSMMDIAKFLKEDKKNIAKVHEAAINGNFDCQLFLSKITHQTLKDQANDPSLDLEQTKKNLERYTRLAAEQGDVDSQVNLAQFYLKLIDTSKDSINEEEATMLKEARYWYEQAASNGRDDLNEIISTLESLK